MYRRFLQRTLIPVVRLSSAIAPSSKQGSSLSYKRHVAKVLSAPLPKRMFAVQNTPEDMIVDFEEVKKASLNNETYIIDVREPDEIKDHGKIPNSINIPLGDVTKVLSTMPEKEFEHVYNRSKPSENSSIIFYCMIGKRSGMAQQNAINVGYKNVKNYLGSWTDWATKMKS